MLLERLDPESEPDARVREAALRVASAQTRLSASAQLLRPPSLPSPLQEEAGSEGESAESAGGGAAASSAGQGGTSGRKAGGGGSSGVSAAASSNS